MGSADGMHLVYIRRKQIIMRVRHVAFNDNVFHAPKTTEYVQN